MLLPFKVGHTAFWE